MLNIERLLPKKIHEAGHNDLPLIINTSNLEHLQMARRDARKRMLTLIGAHLLPHLQNCPHTVETLVQEGIDAYYSICIAVQNAYNKSVDDARVTPGYHALAAELNTLREQIENIVSFTNGLEGITEFHETVQHGINLLTALHAVTPEIVVPSNFLEIPKAQSPHKKLVTCLMQTGAINANTIERRIGYYSMKISSSLGATVCGRMNEELLTWNKVENTLHLDIPHSALRPLQQKMIRGPFRECLAPEVNIGQKPWIAHIDMTIARLFANNTVQSK